MARPERHDVDYFPFIAKRGRTLNILQSRYGLEGIGFFTNLLRFLALTPDHYYCIKEELDMLNFFAEIGLSDAEKGLAMIGLMVRTGKLDRDLWENHKVVACPAFLESVKDAYERRRNRIITVEEIKARFQVPANGVIAALSDTENPQNGFFEGNNPQTKLEETKVKDTEYCGSGEPHFSETCISKNLPEKPPGRTETAGKPKKPRLRDREPENDHERVEKAYLQNWDGLFRSGTVRTPDPLVNWGQTRKLLSGYFRKGLKPEKIIEAVNNGLKNDFVMQGGYSLATMLSSSVLNGLLNSARASHPGAPEKPMLPLDLLRGA